MSVGSGEQLVPARSADRYVIPAVTGMVAAAAPKQLRFVCSPYLFGDMGNFVAWRDVNVVVCATANLEPKELDEKSC